MDTIYKGELGTKAGRRNAWMDALFVDHAVLRILWTNFAAVDPGVLYRSNHPTPKNLEKFVRRVGLKSLINLRGEARNGSDALSRETAKHLKLDFYDLAMESRGAPQKARILRLAEIYNTMQAPALIHCKSGADRAGLASALYLILQGHSVAAAKRQLSLRFGHIKQSNTGILDAFLATYARDGEGRKPFLDWLREDYDEAALRAGFKAGRVVGFVDTKVLRASDSDYRRQNL